MKRATIAVLAAQQQATRIFPTSCFFASHPSLALSTSTSCSNQRSIHSSSILSRKQQPPRQRPAATAPPAPKPKSTTAAPSPSSSPSSNTFINTFDEEDERIQREFRESLKSELENEDEDGHLPDFGQDSNEAFSQEQYEQLMNESSAATGTPDSQFKLNPEILKKLESMSPEKRKQAIEKMTRIDDVQENPGVLIEEKETVRGPSKSYGFQAETRQLMDIVTRSLYADREVFVRELVSNASDALEKLRFQQVSSSSSSSSASSESELPLEISISIDTEKRTFTIQDTGIGMSGQELIENLGTIAKSGSKAFLQQLQNQPSSSSSTKNIIGQFGVGFYSVFMVAERVRVYSRSSSLPGAVGKGFCWSSDGTGTFSVQEADNVQRGTKIIAHLRQEEVDTFGDRHYIEQVVKKHSNFVGFPILVNGVRVNTSRALWLQPAGSISEQEHNDFFGFLTQSNEKPLYRLQYSVDTPLSLRSLLYIAPFHTEKFGLGRMSPGVALYSRRVLIEQKPKGLLPDWLRFVRGVADSEDLPLHVGREHVQDSDVVRRIGQILTKRVLRWLDEESRRDPERYNSSFFDEFGKFLREGALTDVTHKDDIAKLMRYESSHMENGKRCSLDEYVARMKPEQKGIYYLVAPNRSLAESSPYFEAFKSSGVEVLFLYTSIDEFVFSSIGDYRRVKIESIESTELSDLPVSSASAESSAPVPDSIGAAPELKEEQVEELMSWIADHALKGRVSQVRASQRLKDSPAIVVEHDSANLRAMMRVFEGQQRAAQLPPQKLEINPSHPVIRGLYVAKSSDSDLAQIVVEQVFDNALIAAGLLEDSRIMLKRLNSLMERALHTLPSSQISS